MINETILRMTKATNHSVSAYHARDKEKHCEDHKSPVLGW